MTARTGDIARRFDRVRSYLQHALAELADLERHAPGEVAAIAGALVAHLRSWRPEAVPLGTLAPPTEPICDPRGVQ